MDPIQRELKVDEAETPKIYAAQVTNAVQRHGYIIPVQSHSDADEDGTRSPTH